MFQRGPRAALFLKVLQPPSPSQALKLLTETSATASDRGVWLQGSERYSSTQGCPVLGLLREGTRISSPKELGLGQGASDNTPNHAPLPATLGF